MPIKTEVREISPQEAAEILTKNKNNRNVRHAAVASYARDMKAGRWKLNGDSIKFNGDETLIDGQHRLLACVSAAHSFETVVVTGLTDAAHPTIDVGMTRSMADELRWRGEKDVASLASVLTWVFGYDKGLLTSGQSLRQRPSRAELLTVLNRYPQIRDSVLAAASVAKEIRVLVSGLQATHFFISREHDPLVANLFLSHLRKGVNYADGDPCLALRNYALGMTSRRALRPTRSEWLAVTIKTANGFLTGRSIKTLRWRSGGPKAEPFPVLISSSEAGDLSEYVDAVDLA